MAAWLFISTSKLLKYHLPNDALCHVCLDEIGLAVLNEKDETVLMNFAFSLGELAKSCVEFRALFMKSSGIMRKTNKLSNKTVKFVIQDQRVSHMAGFSRRLKIRQTSIKQSN